MAAESGGNKKTSSKRQKEHYKTYKLVNRVQTNKIRKLERHCKNYPNDKKCAERLAELKKKGGYVPRSKPIIPGSNQTTPKPRSTPVWLIPRGFKFSQTAGEQLSTLLGIPLRLTTHKHRKPKVIVRKKKNVQ